MMNKQKLRRLTAILLLIAMLLGMNTAALAVFNARINSSSARVYNVPSTASKVYVTGGKGLVVTVTACSGAWAQVNYKGNTGYILTQFLNLANPVTAYVGKAAPVYAQASTASAKMGTLSIGTAVCVVGKSGSFFRVQNGSGAMGYIPAGYLTSKANLTAAYQTYAAYKTYQAAQTAAAYQAAQKAAQLAAAQKAAQLAAAQQAAAQQAAKLTPIDRVLLLAMSLLGKPYSLYSDNPPSSFNCSSFVEYCMEAYGFSMKSSAADQAAMGNRVSKNSIRKGDVLCFDTDGNGSCDHTAIYMGSNKFIEASQSAGKVQVNTLDDWYQGRLLWAIRPK